MNEEDDLDELLDEVERTLCTNRDCSARPSSSKARKDDLGQSKHSVTKPEQTTRSVTEEVDALLEELLQDDFRGSHRPKNQQSPKGATTEMKLASHSGGRKCCPVFIGGSSVRNGVGTATSKRSCDQLRCTTCDFPVLMFDDCEWDLSCDYLFFRNNVPDDQKLRAKLKKRRGLRAYACQCSWFSTSEPTDLRDRPRLTWVCGQHRD